MAECLGNPTKTNIIFGIHENILAKIVLQLIIYLRLTPQRRKGIAKLNMVVGRNLFLSFTKLFS